MSKQRVEDLVNQLAELRQAFTALQAIVKDQGEEIALLKRNMIRMESDFVYTGPSIAYSTPNKSPSGSQELLSVFQRSDSNSKLSLNIGNSNPVSPRPYLDSYRDQSNDSARGLDSLNDNDVQVVDESACAAEFRRLMSTVEVPYLAFTDTDSAILNRKAAFTSVKTEVDALKALLLESRESRALPEYVGSGSLSTDKIPLVSQGSSFSIANSSPSPSSKTVRLSDGASSLDRGSSRPHPLNASNSTPSMSTAGASSAGANATPTTPLSRQSTASHFEGRGSTGSASSASSTGSSGEATKGASSDKVTKSSRPSHSPSSPAVPHPLPTAGSSASLDKDDDDGPATTGTLTYVTELDYQDLVEETAGRAWPKILNLRRMASVEETKASEKFKQELVDLNVNMIKPADLVFHSLLGRGSSANVYQGMLFTDGDRNGKAQEVAIKILNTSPTDLRSVLKAHKETMDELVVVQRVQSPHVVKLFGITIEPSICIVLEFCHKGSLYDVLCTDIKLSWSQCIQWFREIALGTDALHSSEPAIVHRDMKSLNLLVDEQNKVKVADFGLSRLNEGSADQLATLSKMRGTYIYCAPEIYFGDTFTPLSDVYSIGIIFWEMIVKVVTGNYQRPFGEYPAVSFGFQVVIMSSRKGVRPTIPSCPDVMQKLLISLWTSSAKRRPTCKDLLKIIDHVEQEYLAHKDAWDSGQEYAPELKDVQPPPPEHSGQVLTSAPTPTTAPKSVVVPPPSPTPTHTNTAAAKDAAQTSKEVSKSSSLSKLRKSTKNSLPSLKGIFPAGKEKEKVSKRRSSGRPKPTFDDILTDSKLYKALESRLHKEHSVEYLHFYRATANFTAKFKDRSTQENLLDAKYIETLLPSVSGDDRLIDQIKTKIANSNPDSAMFAEIQGDVTAILRTKFLSLSHD